MKNMSNSIQITFDKELTQLVIDALGIKQCRACKKDITAEDYGGSIKLVQTDELAHYHKNLPCLLQLAAERNK